MKLRYFNTLCFLLICLVSVGCVRHATELPERPKSPPTLTVTKGYALTKDIIVAYQTALINYIRYLEQYYISIGVYYGGDTKPPIYKENDVEQCKVMEHIFKDIKLPPPPRSDDNSVNETLNTLVEHIVDLRKRIRNNNAYMAILRDKYKNCK